MTDKEIIRHDVDVSKCEIYKNSNTRTSCCSGLYCQEEQFKNCHYKQLQRKTAECEELKKEQLEIKKYLGISYKSILERLKELQERRDELSEKNLSYEQALDEIKELIDREDWSILDYVQKDIKDIIKSAKDINVPTKKDGE